MDTDPKIAKRCFSTIPKSLKKIYVVHGNDAAGDYKRHRCLRVILYFRVASVRTEIAGGPENSLYVKRLESARKKGRGFRRFAGKKFESKTGCHDEGSFRSKQFNSPLLIAMEYSVPLEQISSTYGMNGRVPSEL
jgi:hypothetical protein